MRYLPNTEDDRKTLLRAAGAKDIEELFSGIPEKLRFKGGMDVPPGMSENQVAAEMQRLCAVNRSAGRYEAAFLGAGAYRHWTPAAVNHLLLRQEFLTSYTPYQAEIAQGTLQAVFEYQTMMSMLTGLGVANASLYDGASAAAEAALMALRIQPPEKRFILVARSLHPQYRQTLSTYLKNLNVEIEEVPYDGKTGRLDMGALQKCLCGNTAALIVQSPNYFGVIEDLAAASAAAQDRGALSVAVVTEALSLALLKPPGEQGVDICAGEAQSFGGGLNFGGPYLGFMAAREKFMRQMPGRLVGETVDAEGKRGFVLTLSTREQHIRREKATSNICTNEGLVALAASIYLACMGRVGLRKLAEMNVRKAHRFAALLEKKAGLRLLFAGPFFNEFAVEARGGSGKFLEKLRQRNILGGHAFGGEYPVHRDGVLVCVTEMVADDKMEAAAAAFAEAGK
jgi:glycine dehydrogenase subunit 1